MNPKKISILIVDDDEPFRKLLVELLSIKNYTTYEAENGAFGIEEYNLHKPDLIITDLIMPDKEGIEFIQTIRSTNKEIPIVAMSGGNSDFSASYLRASQKLGANKILNKPFESTLLFNTIDELLG